MVYIYIYNYSGGVKKCRATQLILCHVRALILLMCYSQVFQQRDLVSFLHVDCAFFMLYIKGTSAMHCKYFTLHCCHGTIWNIITGLGRYWPIT